MAVVVVDARLDLLGGGTMWRVPIGTVWEGANGASRPDQGDWI